MFNNQGTSFSLASSEINGSGSVFRGSLPLSPSERLHAERHEQMVSGIMAIQQELQTQRYGWPALNS